MVWPQGIGLVLSNWKIFLVVIGFILTLHELKQQERVQKTQLENRLNEEYRENWREVDSELLLNPDYHESAVDGQLDLTESEANAIYSYVDLTNQQIFLRRRGRIRKSRWKDWEQGIQTLIQHPPINAEWKRIKEKTDTEVGRDFDELRRLESPGEDFDTDPYYWDRCGYQRYLRKGKEIIPLL